MDTSLRGAGIGLAVYGLGTAIAFIAIGAPGGEYDDGTVVDYLSRDHWVTGMVLGYVGAFAALGYLVFARRMRDQLGDAGDLFWGLAVAGTAAAVIGWFLVGGMSVSFAEGGDAMQKLPHPVVYLVSEMSDLIAVCASAFLIGISAIVLAAKAALPRPVRIASYVGGVCGIFAAAFFTLFLFWLWAIAVGAWVALRGSLYVAARREPQPA